MRVTVRCRELGTALHHTVDRLTTLTQDPDLIAAVTGLLLTQTAHVQAEVGFGDFMVDKLGLPRRRGDARWPSSRPWPPPTG